MRVLLLGASGMIGQGVLRECLAAPDVTEILAVVRAPLGTPHPKLHEIVRADFTDFSALEEPLRNIDACFYCLGASSAGMSEADYRRVTVDYPVALATTLQKASPKATFCFVSGEGSDDTGTARAMWSRVKGEAENALKAFSFRLFIFRPGYIQPMDGIVSKTASYRLMYVFAAPLYPVWRRLFPSHVTSTRELGQAMLQVTRRGFARQVLGSTEINEAAHLLR